jgi:hypothetical protein
MGKDVTTEEWVARAKRRWGNHFDYSRAEFKGKNNRIIVGCPKHGWIEVDPHTHLLSRPGSTGCPRCGKEQAGARRRRFDWDERHAQQKQKRKLSEADFKERLKQRWGEAFELVDGTFTTTAGPIHVVCTIHRQDILYGRAGNLLANTKLYPCVQCKVDEKTRLFIQRAKIVHGDTYDYSKSVWNPNGDPIIVVCPKHGAWESGMYHAKPSAQSGCPKCALLALNRGRIEEAARTFEAKARAVHSGDYNYSRVEYINNHTPVEIFCKKHNLYFLQIPNSHLSGSGCPECALEKSRGDRIPSIEGMTFGRLTVVRLDHVKRRRGRLSGSHKYWLCRCTCGKEAIVFQTSLTVGQTRSCGCLKHDNLINQEISGLGDPETASIETELYFVQVGGIFQKFGISIYSAERRGGSDYTLVLWRARDRRDVIVPVEIVLHEMTRSYFDVKEIERAGYDEWPGWSELRCRMDVNFWTAKAEQLLIECRVIGHEQFIANYFDE